ncbi:MAG: hypothetical protein CFE31_08425 [Rhizobiales bacterium PAR1]|nr:MAG: hypothetical protein CFE31_08425 [Rhizobiales bacterium PAR1]
MSLLDRFTIRQIVAAGMLGLIALALAPAAKMLGSLSDIQDTIAVTQVRSLPLSKTIASLRVTLQELDNTQLRYLHEREGKADREKEIEAGFRSLQILVAKLRFGSESPEYKGERAKLTGKLAEDDVLVPADVLPNQSANLANLARRVAEAEAGFARLREAHREELGLIVGAGANARSIDVVAADLLVDFRTWVNGLDQVVEYNSRFDGNLDLATSMLGKTLAVYKPSNSGIARSLKAAERSQERIFHLARTINERDGEAKAEIFNIHGKSDFKRYEAVLGGLIVQARAAADAAQAKVRESLEEFHKIGADVFRLTDIIEADAKAGSDAAITAANTTIHDTVSITWTSVGLIAGLAPLLGLLIGYLVLGPIGSMARATEAVAAGQLDTAVPGTTRRDQLGQMGRALQVFQQNIAETQRLRAESAAQEQLAAARKAEEMETLAQNFEKSVLGIVDHVAGAAATMQGQAASFLDSAQRTSGQATQVASTASETSSNVRTVAVATEELSASVRDIAEQTAGALRLTEDATRRAQESVQIMASLDQIVAQIGEVVGVINQIASQTNLLALNATIEAARAGEAGRGFAVVASEVKALASQTSRATDDIADKINSVKAATSEAVRAIREINEVIPQIGEVSNIICNAMNEQDRATQDIAGNIEQAARGVENVTSVIADVARVTGQNGEAADGLLVSADTLRAQSATLKQEVSTFLTRIRAA